MRRIYQRVHGSAILYREVDAGRWASRNADCRQAGRRNGVKKARRPAFMQAESFTKGLAVSGAAPESGPRNLGSRTTPTASTTTTWSAHPPVFNAVCHMVRRVRGDPGHRVFSAKRRGQEIFARTLHRNQPPLQRTVRGHQLRCNPGGAGGSELFGVEKGRVHGAMQKP